MICAVYRGDERFSKDPRYVAENLDSMLQSKGLRAFVSPKLGFLIFDSVNIYVDSWKRFVEIKSSEGCWSGFALFNIARVVTT